MDAKGHCHGIVWPNPDWVTSQLRNPAEKEQTELSWVLGCCWEVELPRWPSPLHWKDSSLAWYTSIHCKYFPCHGVRGGFSLTPVLSWKSGRVYLYYDPEYWIAILWRKAGLMTLPQRRSKTFIWIFRSLSANRDELDVLPFAVQRLLWDEIQLPQNAP